MERGHLYQLLQPTARSAAGRTLRWIHHAMVAGGIGIMLAMTEPRLATGYRPLVTVGFIVVATFFAVEYALRLFTAPAAPGGEHRGALRARLSYALSLGGIFDLLGVVPGITALTDQHEASLLGFVWVFKLVRYSPGLTVLQRVIVHARNALSSVLLAFSIVLLATASLAYLLESKEQPASFGTIPLALWWAIVTLTTTGYGDVVPHTLAGRMLAAMDMVLGILVVALGAGILATGYAQEMRRQDFLHTWDLVARVPFFRDLGAPLIAEVARLLRGRDYPANTVIMRRGEPGDCMYFIVDGEVAVQLQSQSVRLGAGDFVGELALLTGAPRNATVVAIEPCTLLALDVVDFFELIARHPVLARVIHDAAVERLEPGSPMHAALRTIITKDRARAS